MIERPVTDYDPCPWCGQGWPRHFLTCGRPYTPTGATLTAQDGPTMLLRLRLRRNIEGEG